MRRHGLVTALASTLLVAGALCAYRGGTDPPPPNGSHDPSLFAAVVERVRAGETYYPVMGEELHARGYQSGSPFNWRLPTLTVFQSLLPSLWTSTLALTALSLAACWLWLRSQTKSALPARAGFGIALVTALPLWPWFSSSSIVLHDLWAGQLIFLSLACWASGRWIPSVGVGWLALAVREHSAVFVVVMGVAALLERRPREAAAWLLGLAGFAAFEVWHVQQLRPFIMPGPPEPGWLSLGGWCFVLLTARVNVLLLIAPGWILAAFVPWAVAGLLVWRSAEGRRVAGTVGAYLGLFCALGRPDNWYWGLLVAPLLPLAAAGWLSVRGFHSLSSRYQRAD